jgi:hypothetical protein
MGMLGKSAGAILDRGDRYGAKKEAERTRNARASATGRDIAADWPGWGNQFRRAKGRQSLRVFLTTYFPDAFPLPFSPDHLKVIEKIEAAIRNGGLFALAMPRGSGKTTIVIRAMLWALLNGYRRFGCLIGATERDACRMLEHAKKELLHNTLLAKDFPEVCYPLRRLEDNARRCKGQLWDGAQTSVEWGPTRITFPTIPKSKVSGSTLTVAGLTGALRGQSHVLQSGEIIRPTFILADDPQTREAAFSKIQTEQRLAIINGDLLGMAGPGQTVACVVPTTVIAGSDVADQLLDRTRNPQWQGERTRMVYSFPTNEKLWQTYRDMREDAFRNDGDGSQASAFYAANREAMDAGAVVAWPERFNQDELSAIQNAMNLRFRNEEAFMAEYQNDPKPPAIAGEVVLSAEEIRRKTNGRQLGEVPKGCECLTAFIDVHDDLLFWAVCGWESDFTGYGIEYGSFPEQSKRYYTLSSAQPTLQQQFSGGGKESAILAGLEYFAGELLSRQYARDDGSTMQIGRLLIDSGYVPEIVTSAIRKLNQTAVAMPSKGIGVTAGSKPFSEYERRPGDVVGHYWRIPAAHGRGMRVVHVDTNYWKTLLQGRLAIPLGDRGAFSLYGTDRTDHQLVADHLAAEYRIQTQGRGRTVYEWKPRPGASDNHLLDCFVGCAVAASMLGCSLPGSTSAPRPRVRRPISEWYSTQQPTIQD